MRLGAVFESETKRVETRGLRNSDRKRFLDQGMLKEVCSMARTWSMSSFLMKSIVIFPSFPIPLRPLACEYTKVSTCPVQPVYRFLSCPALFPRPLPRKGELRNAGRTPPAHRTPPVFRFGRFETPLR